MTYADAQAFKRACSCFGLGRYFYDFPVFWVDLDQNRQPARTPALSAWALPENWLKGMRPPGKNGNGRANASNQVSSAKTCDGLRLRAVPTNIRDVSRPGCPSL
jgi:hypothetical protein